jgi:hypothetical protein
LKTIKKWINVDVIKRNELKKQMKKSREIYKYASNKLILLYTLIVKRKIAQNIHHTVLKTKFNLKKITVVDDDHNSL